ncbi:MAG: hypothetical protein HDQ87_08970 [Clostridia bacterium]|nr:hypothetical protein [Clostridia bacterium]
MEETEIPRNNVDTTRQILYFETGKTVPGRMILLDDREEMNRAYLEINDFGFYGAYTDERYQTEPAGGTGLTAQQAASLAEETADRLGFDYMDVTDVLVGDRYSNLFPEARDDEQQCYHVLFSRTYDGVKSPTVFLHAWNSTGVDDDNLQPASAPRTPEYLVLAINENGVVGLRWQNPVEIIGIEDETVPVIGFEQAKDAFVKNISLALTESSFLEDLDKMLQSGFMDDNEIHITRVVLGNQFLPAADTPGEYKLMPCWIFLGYDGWLGDMSRNVPTCELMLDAVTGAVV